MNQPKTPEFEAFQAVYNALEPLDEETRSRVTRSVVTLLDIDARVRPADDEEAADEASVERAEEAPESAPVFSTFAELCAAANPTTDALRALVAGYWLQVCQGNDSFTGQAANKELTHLGHKCSNITSAINYLQKSRPQLVLQLRKSGTSKQARKTYKLSDAGVRRVQEMIRG